MKRGWSVSCLMLLLFLLLGACGSQGNTNSSTKAGGNHGEGGLANKVKSEVGDFTLKQDSIKRDKQTLSNGATEALVMTYVAPDGTELEHHLASFPSAQKANRALQSNVEHKEDEGFEKLPNAADFRDQDGQKIGAWVLLQKKNTYVWAWTKHDLKGVVEGPQSYATELYNAIASPPLANKVKSEVGDFTLKQDSIKRDKQTLSNGATEALVMTYVAPDGTELEHHLASFPSAQRANQALQSNVEHKEDEGFEKMDWADVVSQDGQKYGAYVLLQKKNTYVWAWTNDYMKAVVEGPQSYATELYNAISASAY